MKATLGQLISELYDTFERRYHDADLSAVATQVTLHDLLDRSAQPRRPMRPGRSAALDQPSTRPA